MTTYKCDYCGLTATREIYTYCPKSPTGEHVYSELPECPQCGGYGRVWYEPYWYEADLLDHPAHDEGHYVTCPLCNGSGVIPE